MIDNHKSLLNVLDDSVEINMIIDHLLETLEEEFNTNDCCIGSAIETGIDFLSI